MWRSVCCTLWRRCPQRCLRQSAEARCPDGRKRQWSRRYIRRCTPTCLCRPRTAATEQVHRGIRRRPRPISCSRSRRLLSPITLRVLMLRRRTGACDMEKLAKLMRATSSNSTTASCSMQYTVLLPRSVSGSCPSIKVLSNGSAENRILPRYSFISFELTPYSVHTSLSIFF